MTDESGRITQREYIKQRFDDTNKLIELNRQVMLGKLDAIHADIKRINGTAQDNQGRINKLENWRWYLVGVIVGTIFVAEMVMRYVI